MKCAIVGSLCVCVEDVDVTFNCCTVYIFAIFINLHLQPLLASFFNHIRHATAHYLCSVAANSDTTPLTFPLLRSTHTRLAVLIIIIIIGTS